MKKEKKEQTPKQKAASERNWLKARIITARSINHGGALVTSAERRILNDIDDLYKILLKGWDAKTKIILNDKEQI